jgi:predicted O-methyltransferase YrrM
MTLTIRKSEISKIDLGDFYTDYPHQDRHHLLEPQGQSEHRLLAYISTLVSETKIADVGSRTGNSALALSYNSSNYVDSYDINPNYFSFCRDSIRKDNLTFHLKDICSGPEMATLLQYSVINLDIDPHEGTVEQRVTDFLAENQWKGLLILDDIHYGWEKLTEVWGSIELPKVDATEFGHASGTGLVLFGDWKVE